MQARTEKSQQSDDDEINWIALPVVSQWINRSDHQLLITFQLIKLPRLAVRCFFCSPFSMTWCWCIAAVATESTGAEQEQKEEMKLTMQEESEELSARNRTYETTNGRVVKNLMLINLLFTYSTRLQTSYPLDEAYKSSWSGSAQKIIIKKQRRVSPHGL